MDKKIIYNDVKEALSLSMKTKNNYYSNYCAVHLNSNENLKAISKILDFKGKKVLLTGSSGDQYLTAKLNGSEDETIFDINSLAQYFIYFKIGAIKTLDYNTFIRFINPNNNDFMNRDIVENIIRYLPYYIALFWKEYIDEVRPNEINNFIFSLKNKYDINNLIKTVPFYNKMQYKKLKKILENSDYPKFICKDLFYLNEALDNNNLFDIIYLSNIIDCQNNDFDCEYPFHDYDMWIYFIENILSKYLNKDGKILVDYKLICNGELEKNELYNYKNFEMYKVKSQHPNEKSAVLVYKRK